MNIKMGMEDRIASIVAVLELLTNCDDNVEITTVQSAALLALLLVNDLRLVKLHIN